MRGEGGERDTKRVKEERVSKLGAGGQDEARKNYPDAQIEHRLNNICSCIKDLLIVLC